jgi:hypothetical protein
MEATTASVDLDQAEIDRVLQESGINAQLQQNNAAAGELGRNYATETAAVLNEETTVEGEAGSEAGYQATKEETQYLEQVKKDFTEPKNPKDKPDPEQAAKFEKRYQDERVTAAVFQKEVAEFAGKSGLTHEPIPGLEGKAFSSESKQAVLEKVAEHVDRLLADKEKGRNNPEKHRLLLDETKKYLDLVEQAQREGDISAEISADDVLKLVEENVWTTAYQDRIASENTLGDHGIRHIVGYNIRMCDKMYQELADQGQPVKAIDQIAAHQIMITHDQGYATAPVKEGIDAGDFASDKGHNLLSAKILRERGENPNDVMSKVFSKDQLALMHEGVLRHDSSEVKFHVGDNSKEARKDNLLSAVHLADNTHAFEDKLPEILYAVPESIEAMRLLKTAGEIGDEETLEKIKLNLVDTVKNNPDYSTDDKAALEKAIMGTKDANGKVQGGLTSTSYKFTAGRICGNKPDISIARDGHVTISVQESAIHQEVVGLFGQKSYKQLEKFVDDLTGKRGNVDLDQASSLTSEKIDIKIAKGEGREKEKTDWEQKIDAMVERPVLQEWSRDDLPLSEQQDSLETALKMLEKGKTTEADLEHMRDDREGLIKDNIEAQIAEIKTKRKTLFEQNKKGLGLSDGTTIPG